MVLPAVLRHPAIDPEQVAGRDSTFRFDRRVSPPAVARHIARQVGAVPAALCEILLAVCDRLHWPWLARHQVAGRNLFDLVTLADLLLLRIFPARAAGTRTL